MTGTVLILGGNGRFGSHAAEAFWNQGWRVRLHNRRTGDLMKEAEGADVIVNGWNPPYPDWATEVPGLTEKVIDAARISDATVILPGNVYVFGADAPEVFSTDTAHGATNALGRIRIAMEARYKSAGTRVILLRAGDFLDTTASGNWFDKVMAPPLNKGRLVYPGRTDIPHAWAFLPDLAAAAVGLADRRESLPRFADIPFPGYTLSGEELAELAAQALDRPVRVKRMTWAPLYLAQPVWKMARHLVEMRYLWDTPHRLDGQALADWLPDFRPTPVEDAIADAVAPVVTAGSDRPRRGRAGRHSLPAA